MAQPASNRKSSKILAWVSALVPVLVAVTVGLFGILKGYKGQGKYNEVITNLDIYIARGRKFTLHQDGPRKVFLEEVRDYLNKTSLPASQGVIKDLSDAKWEDLKLKTEEDDKKLQDIIERTVENLKGLRAGISRPGA